MANLSQIRREKLLAALDEVKFKYSKDDVMLTTLGDIEKQLTDKKYGLVWEEHEERVDIELRTQIPVFKDVKDKEINMVQGKPFNFLLEGDNLHSLYLLEKTHYRAIDLIYIDPPYNTGSKDFIYNDEYVEKEDGFSHSKWISFMEKRLQIAKKLISKSGVIAISIGYHEVHHLMVLCEELFDNKQIVCVTIQTSGGKPNGGFNYLQEYIVFITPLDFNPNPLNFSGGKVRTPFEGLTLSTFNKVNRPNQVYPIFINKETKHIFGVGKSLTDRINDGSYTGNKEDFKYDSSEAPEGTVAIWPISSKGNDCVWRLISDRLISDWNKGYIKVTENKYETNPNKFSVQYLPEGVIKKIENGILEVVGTEDGMPTLVFGTNQTEGCDIPTIWTEKDFYTVKGTGLIKELFGDNVFSYPKPVELIKEIIRATCNKEGIILDFFAGSGTTGQAVLEVNEEDEGNRRFILCTNNQNNICEEVTYKRLKKVIDGYKVSNKKDVVLYKYIPKLKDLGEMAEHLKKAEIIIEDNQNKYNKIVETFNGGILQVVGTIEKESTVEGIPTNLKYYKTDYIYRIVNDELEEGSIPEQLMHFIQEMIQLEYALPCGSGVYEILFSDEQADEWEVHPECLINMKRVFVSNDVLLTTNQIKMFKDRNIEMVTVPQYYFLKELKEAGEI